MNELCPSIYSNQFFGGRMNCEDECGASKGVGGRIVDTIRLLGSFGLSDTMVVPYVH